MWFDDSFFDEFRRMQREMSRLHQQMMGMDSYPLLPGGEAEVPAEQGAPPYRVPVTDLRETESGFIAAIELPGVDKKDIELTVTERAIEIKVDKREEKKAEEKGISSHSAVSRHFYRSFPLPKPVVPGKAKAELRQGVLRVEAPKAEKTGGSQRINID